MSLQLKVKSTPKLLLNQSWFSGIPEEQHEEIRKRVIENRDLFEIIENIIKRKLQENAVQRRSKRSYDMPAYSEFQADCNGVERTCESLLTILKLTKENKNV